MSRALPRTHAEEGASACAEPAAARSLRAQQRSAFAIDDVESLDRWLCQEIDGLKHPSIPRIFFAVDLGDPTLEDDSDTFGRRALRTLRALQLAGAATQAFVPIENSGTASDAGNKAFAFLFRAPDKKRDCGLVFEVSSDTPPNAFSESLHDVIHLWSFVRGTLEQKEREEKLNAWQDRLRDEQNETMMRMVEAIAHDCNTPLGIVRSAASTIQEISNELSADAVDTEDREDMVEAVELIEDNARQIEVLLVALKESHRRRQAEAGETVDMRALIHETIELFRRTCDIANPRISIIDRVTEGLESWLGDPSALEQLLQHILKLGTPRDKAGRPLVLCPRSYVEDGQVIFGLDVSPWKVPPDAPGVIGVKKLAERELRGRYDIEPHAAGNILRIRFSHQPVTGGVRRPQSGLQRVEQFVYLHRKLHSGKNLNAFEQLMLNEGRRAFQRLVDGRYTGHERRAAPRIPTHQQIEVQLSEHHRTSSELRDISASGAMHVFREAIKKGSKVVLHYGFQNTFRIDAEVMSSVELQSPGTQDIQWQTGLRFLDVDAEDASRLAAWLAEIVLSDAGRKQPTCTDDIKENPS